MIIRHTRRVTRGAGHVPYAVFDRVSEGWIGSDWVIAGAIDLGGLAQVLVLTGPGGMRDHRFLDGTGSPVATDAAGFLALPWDGPGPLDWTADTLITDGESADDIRAMIEDLHILIEALATAAARTAEPFRILIGADADARSVEMLGTIARLNRAPADAPPHLSEMVTKEIVLQGGQRTEHPDGGKLHLSLYVPMPGFRFAGFSQDPREPLCTLIAKNSRATVALFDLQANRVYAKRRPDDHGFDARTLCIIKLWRNYLHTQLVAGQRRSERIGIVFEHAHISHYIWNELAAVDEMLALGRAPSVFLFASCNEPVFAVDAVFPDIADHVRRGLDGPLPTLQTIAAGEAAFLPFRSYRVSQRLADRLAALATAAERELDARLAEAAEHATIVLIGLRLENRQWVRQLDGYSALIRRLGRRRGERFLVVVDGHNTLPGAGGFIESHCESLVPRTGPVPHVVQLELDLVAALQSNAAGIRNVAIMSLVPCTMAASLVASLRANLFVTHFGAGLAKYKWVANAHGCVVSSRAVLDGKDDLRIYDTDIFRENVTPCIYYPSERITDLDRSDNAVLVPGGKEREDFDLDPDDFARFVQAQLPRKTEGVWANFRRRLKATVGIEV